MDIEDRLAKWLSNALLGTRPDCEELAAELLEILDMRGETTRPWKAWRDDDERYDRVSYRRAVAYISETPDWGFAPYRSALVEYASWFND